MDTSVDECSLLVRGGGADFDVFEIPVFERFSKGTNRDKLGICGCEGIQICVNLPKVMVFTGGNEAGVITRLENGSLGEAFKFGVDETKIEMDLKRIQMI